MNLEDLTRARRIQYLERKHAGKWVFFPSSIFERFGHKDWNQSWKNDLEAIQCLLDYKIFKKNELIFRGHPHWDKRSKSSCDYYQEWCNKNNVEYIPSDNKTDTQYLILKSKGIITFGSSSCP